MKALIFGSNGQDGKFLIEFLNNKNVDVITFSRNNSIIIGSVSDYNLVDSTIKYHKPDFIFHLAANSSTSHDVIFENHETISTGTINILESCRIHSPKSKIFLSGSAMQFKNKGEPIDENVQFEARSPYAISRIQSTYAGRYYRDVFGMNIYIGYFFNHDSELRSEKHINQKIAAAAKRISKGSNEKLKVGNIYVLKEFNYAEDFINAIWILINQNRVFEVVIGSGLVYSIKDWATNCFKNKGLNWEDHLIIDNNFIAEYSILISNPSLMKSLGWETKYNFNNLVDIMMK